MRRRDTEAYKDTEESTSAGGGVSSLSTDLVAEKLSCLLVSHCVNESFHTNNLIFHKVNVYDHWSVLMSF